MLNREKQPPRRQGSTVGTLNSDRTSLGGDRRAFGSVSSSLFFRLNSNTAGLLSAQLVFVQIRTIRPREVCIVRRRRRSASFVLVKLASRRAAVKDIRVCIVRYGGQIGLRAGWSVERCPSSAVSERRMAPRVTEHFNASRGSLRRGSGLWLGADRVTAWRGQGRSVVRAAVEPRPA